MGQLLADENFPMPAVIRLRELGHDVLTLIDLELAGQSVPDDEVLMLATQLTRCLLTLNRRDFIKLHQQSDKHTGIVICTTDIDYIRLANRVHQVLTQANEPVDGQLLRVQRPNP